MNRIIVTTEEILEELIKTSIRTALSEQSTSIPKDLNVNEFLNMEEAAKFLKIPKASLYQLTSKRKISFVNRSRRNFFKISDLTAWQEKGRKKTLTEIEHEAFQKISKGSQK